LGVALLCSGVLFADTPPAAVSANAPAVAVPNVGAKIIQRDTPTKALPAVLNTGVQAVGSVATQVVNPKATALPASSEPGTRVAPVNDLCENAIYVGTYPTVLDGTTIEATVDCPDVLGWTAVWYMLNLPYAANDVYVGYCGLNADLGTAGIVLVPDCTCNGYLISTYTWVMPCQSTGFDGLDQNWANLPGPGTILLPAYVLDVNSAGMDFQVTFDVTEHEVCDVECPQGGILEGEPECYDEYVDAFNGGCNSTPNVFSPIACGETICGKYGTYLFGGASYRDTDWYVFTLTQSQLVTWTVTGEAQNYIFILTGVCPTAVIAQSNTANPCEPAVASATLGPGTYYVWAGPAVFTGVPCSSDYVGTLECEDLPIGACCINEVCVGDMTDPDCTGSWWPGETCADFDCPGCADYIVDAPGSWSGNTCSAGNDCALGASSPEYIYAVNLGDVSNWRISLCGSSYDTYLYVGTTCCGMELGYNDDFCGLQSQLDISGVGGTIYVDVEGFSTGCGDYVLTITDLGGGSDCDTCSNACPVAALPFDATGYSCSFLNNYDEACPYSGSTAPDVVYAFTPATDMFVDINLCNDGTDYDTKLFVYEDACPGVVAGCNDDMCTSPQYPYAYVSRLSFTPLQAGHTYYIVVDGYGASCGNYHLTINEVFGEECPPGATMENEPVCGDEYVDATNGGCNSSPNVFQPIACGETYCGESGTYLFAGSSYRDTDWFALDLTATSSLTWSVWPTFPLQLFIIDGGSGNCADYSILVSGSGPAAQWLTLSVECMPPGLYWMWVGPSVFSGVPCGSDWIGTLTCDPCTGACCLPEDPFCVVVDSATCAGMGGAYLGAFTTCDFGSDCNVNGSPDACDFALCGGEAWCDDCNNNGQLDYCDVPAPDGNCVGADCSVDCQPNGIPDECELWTTGRLVYQYDDGATENSLGWTNGGELVWLHHFTAQLGSNAIDTVMTSFGSALYPGSSGVVPDQVVRVFIWSDPDGDGNPTDAAFVREVQGTVEAGAIDTDIPQSITINPPVCIEAPDFPNDSFFVGASVVHAAGSYPAPLDQSVASLGRAWICGAIGGVFDPNVMSNLYEMDAIGYGGVWILRANGVGCGAPPNDCNENGVPDECDIAYGTSDDCKGGPPGACSDGIPDECQGCDLNGDSAYNYADFLEFADAFGACVNDTPPSKYICAADMDCDGCITLKDYGLWLECYLGPHPPAP
jgi:hypothetical protein